MTSYPKRFDPAKQYHQVAFADEERHLHSADVNDLQEILADRIKTVSDALISDGDVLDGGVIAVDAATGRTVVEAGVVYARGIAHRVEAAELTIPTDRTVAVGLCLTESYVSYLDDPDLVGRVPGTRAYGEPMQDRKKIAAVWSWDGAACDGGLFVPVYQVVNGQLLDRQPPPQLDPVNDAIARYDREANGHYVVNGWQVRALGPVNGQQHFSIGEGTINVWGQKITRQTAYRLSVDETPDLREIPSEPHVVSTEAGGAVTIALNHGPVTEVRTVTVLREKTADITHGPYLGATDPLPDGSVSEIVAIRQGAAVYQAGRDFLLDADQIDWSPTGGDEPAPGSTYQVTYRHLVTEAPAVFDDVSVTVDDPVPGSTVIVGYQWAPPRIDVIAVNRSGEIIYIPGQAADFDPVPPDVPADLAPLAQVTNRWFRRPEVDNIATRSVHYNQIEVHGELLADLYDLVAQERLKRDMDARQVTAKRGVFVDPLLDDDMRDQGIAQTAAVVEDALHLPVDVTSQAVQLTRVPSTLGFREEPLIAQTLITGSFKINPYQAFEPLPARVHLDPAVDRWVETRSQWASSATRAIIIGRGNRRRLTRREWSVEDLGTWTQEDAFLRPRQVLFEIEGFGAGENLTRVVFDGVEVAPAPNPATGAALTADAQGRLSGVFQVPENIPAGAKEVLFEGAGGSRGAATYIGQGRIETQTFRMLETLTFRRFRADPLAQTFRLAENRQVSSIDIQFTEIGDRAKPVAVQIRATDLGLPSQIILAETWLDMAAATTGVWTKVAFSAPVPLSAGVEYAVVLLTDDANHAVATAGVGDFDAAQQRFVAAQPYQVGVLLSSSNASTWTPHQNHDLSFRLNGAVFTENRRQVALPEPVELVECTDLMIDLGVELPAAGTRAVLTVTRADGSQIEMLPGQPMRFDSPVSGTVEIAVTLQGTAQASPVVFPWMQITQGRVAPSGDYITRAIPCGAGDVNVVVTFDALIPAGAEVRAQAGSPGAWADMRLLDATPLGDGWQERSYVLENYAGADVRVRLELSGNAAARPQVKNIRANVTPDPVNIITQQ